MALTHDPITVTLDQVRAHVAARLAGRLSRDDVEDGFTLASWNVHQQGDPVLTRRVGAVALALAEYQTRPALDHRLIAVLTEWEST